jgi:hypothetical protein
MKVCVISPTIQYFCFALSEVIHQQTIKIAAWYADFAKTAQRSLIYQPKFLIK